MIITLNPKKPFCIIDPDNCDYIISVKYVSAAGEIISPMLIILEVNILHK